VEYGAHLAAAVAREHVMGIQFHPEKSSRAGLRVLRNFLEYPC
jgi:glutamine amidotransferase